MVSTGLIAFISTGLIFFLWMRLRGLMLAIAVMQRPSLINALDQEDRVVEGKLFQNLLHARVEQQPNSVLNPRRILVCF